MGGSKRSRKIAKIEDVQKRHVAFTKRRQTIFKHAERLDSSQVAVIVFSPGGRPFTFGDTSVAGRYLRESERNADPTLEENNGGGGGAWNWEESLNLDDCWTLEALTAKRAELMMLRSMVRARLSSSNKPSPSSVLAASDASSQPSSDRSGSVSDPSATPTADGNAAALPIKNGEDDRKNKISDVNGPPVAGSLDEWLESFKGQLLDDDGSGKSETRTTDGGEAAEVQVGEYDWIVGLFNEPEDQSNGLMH